MLLDLPGRPHLTYCTNIHPGETLADVRRIVREHLPRVRERVGVSGPFGVGLRLSARAAEELEGESALSSFRALLDEHNLYVFTINGFPHGNFHGERVKESVYRPDWREDARVAYSDRLARLLARLLPDGTDGSVSTVPGAFGARVSGPGDVEQVRARLIRHAEALFRVREETGKLVELALEPEPSCFLETSGDAVRFFTEEIFSATSAAELSSRTGLSTSAAQDFLRRHVGLCLDACHLAVEFEEAGAAVRAFRDAGVRIGKIQITAALVADLPGGALGNAAALAALERFADPVYFHQVVRRRQGPDDGALTRHVDLPDALAAERASGANEPSEWRIHFHVPVFARSLGAFRSTEPFLRDLLNIVRVQSVSSHLEVETYTWDVLPPEHRAGSVDDAIALELGYVLERVGLRPS